jgi:hypothetical protein
MEGLIALEAGRALSRLPPPLVARVLEAIALQSSARDPELDDLLQRVAT